MKSTDFYYWNGSSWVGPEENQIKVRIVDSFLKPKFAEVTLTDVDHVLQDSGNYSAYKRIKVVDINANKPIFFGRIEFVDAQNTSSTGPSLVLQARDFLNELTEDVVSHDFSGAVYLSDLIKDIIDYYVYSKIVCSVVSSFTINEHANAGNWIKTTGGGTARLMYKDTSTNTLVITDVTKAETFTSGTTITEYSNEACTIVASGSTILNADLIHNINTSELASLHLGTIEVETAQNYLKSSSSPLECITQLCLHGSSDATYHFFLDEGSDSSLYPPVFKLFERETRPIGGTANGLTIKYEGTDGNQERIQYDDYSFPLPEREIYTEAQAISSDTDDKLISSTKKAGEIAFDLEVFKKRTYQALEHATQAGLDNSVNRFIALTGTESIQRGKVSITHYPYFYKSGIYTVVHTCEKVLIVNDRITYAVSPGRDMIITEIQYEEPNGTSRLNLLQTTYGIGPEEYTYPNTTIGTSYPPSMDTRIIDFIPEIPVLPPWNDILPQAIQGYNHNLNFTATSWKEVSWDSEDTAKITFYDGTYQVVDSPSSTTAIIPGGNGIPNDEIQYIWFDLEEAIDKDTPLALHCSAVDDYIANDLSMYTGTLCVCQRSLKGSLGGGLATILPNQGKQPYISTDWIDMNGMKEWTDPLDPTKSFKAVMGTQIQAGYIKLTADISNELGEWYNTGGVAIDATRGIDIYTSGAIDMAFATIKSLPDNYIVSFTSYNGGLSTRIDLLYNSTGVDVGDRIRIFGTTNYNGGYAAQAGTDPGEGIIIINHEYIAESGGETKFIGTVQCYVNTNGAISAASDTVVMDSQGLWINGQSLIFMHGATPLAGMGYVDVLGTESLLLATENTTPFIIECDSRFTVVLPASGASTTSYLEMVPAPLITDYGIDLYTYGKMLITAQVVDLSASVVLRLPTEYDDPANVIGNIYYKIGTNKIRWYNGVTWADIGIGSGGLANVVEDLSPQLGGDLDTLENDINITTSIGTFIGKLYGSVEHNVNILVGTGVSGTDFLNISADIDMGGTHKIVDLATPTTDYDAATKKYVDDNSINNVSEDTSPTLGGNLDCDGKYLQDVAYLEFSPDGRNYIESSDDDLNFAVKNTDHDGSVHAMHINHGDIPSLDMANNKIVSLATPTTDYDAATKKYVDDNSINNVYDDTTPELYANLECNLHNITELTELQFTNATSVTYISCEAGDNYDLNFFVWDGISTPKGTGLAMYIVHGAVPTLNMNTHKIVDLGTPTEDTDAVTKKYVDDKTPAGMVTGSGTSGYLTKWNGTSTITDSTYTEIELGQIYSATHTHSGTSGYLTKWSANNVVGDSTYTEVELGQMYNMAHSAGSDTSLGAQIEALDMNSHQITNVTDPTANQHAATKKYVDDHVPSGAISGSGTSGYLTKWNGTSSITDSSYTETELGQMYNATHSHSGTSGYIAIWTADDVLGDSSYTESELATIYNLAHDDEDTRDYVETGTKTYFKLPVGTNCYPS